MKKRIYFLSLILTSASIFLISCNKNKDNDHIESLLSLLDETDYFPLHVGDYWHLDFLHERNIDIEENIDGYFYHRMISSDTAYYRKSIDGKVYVRNASNNETLIFDLNAEVNDSWTFSWTYSEQQDYTVTLQSKSDTIELDNYTFTHCYRFYFDVPQLADEEMIIWLAPGVGTVEVVYLGGTSTRKKLNQVRIDNVEILF